MDSSEITGYRLASQQIEGISLKTPGELVSYMGATQAQSYQDALWAVGLRLDNVTKADVEQAINNKEIVRTWPMRHTLHFVSHKDVRWMLSLYHEEGIPSYQRRNGLTESILRNGERIIANAFVDRDRLTSKQIYSKLEGSGIPAMKKHEVQAHILRRSARDGIVCYASHDGKQPTFALLDKWIAQKKDLPMDDALSELATRYFTSHGPATIKDFVWWSGLRMPEARRGIEKASGKLSSLELNGRSYYMSGKAVRPRRQKKVHLLPAFDEYIVGYSDRSAMLMDERTQKMLKSGKIFFTHSNGVFLPVIVADGQVVGVWKRINVGKGLEIRMQLFVKLSQETRDGIREEAARYEDFLGMQVKVS